MFKSAPRVHGMQVHGEHGFGVFRLAVVLYGSQQDLTWMGSGALDLGTGEDGNDDDMSSVVVGKTVRKRPKMYRHRRNKKSPDVARRCSPMINVSCGACSYCRLATTKRCQRIACSRNRWRCPRRYSCSSENLTAACWIWARPPCSRPALG